MCKFNNLEEKISKYEKVTRKKAIWHGMITNDFKKWQKGEKIYIDNKKRINFLISKVKKNEWKEYTTINNINTISKLIRNAVDFYIDTMPKITTIKKFSKFINLLIKNLNSIEKFTDILIQEHKNELNWEALLKIKETIDKSVDLENILDDIINLNEKFENLHLKE